MGEQHQRQHNFCGSCMYRVYFAFLLFYFIRILCLIFPFAAVEAYARKLNVIVPFGSLLLAELFAWASKWNCLEIISRDCTADLELKEAWLGASFVHFWVRLEILCEVKFYGLNGQFITSSLWFVFGLGGSSALVLFGALPKRAQIKALVC